MSTVATRLLSMIWTLQSQPLTTAGELAADLGVSERTVHRYIGMLEEMGIPIASERGRGGGFYLVRGYKLPPLRFTAQEASALYLGADVVRRIGGLEYHDAALAARAYAATCQALGGGKGSVSPRRLSADRGPTCAWVKETSRW